MNQENCPHCDGDRLSIETGLSPKVWVCLDCGAMQFENEPPIKKEIPNVCYQTELF